MEPEGSLPSSQHPSMVHILNQINSSYFFKIKFNIILPSISKLSKCRHALTLPINILYACYIPRPPLIFIFGEEFEQWSSWLWNFLQPSDTSSQINEPFSWRLLTSHITRASYWTRLLRRQLMTYTITSSPESYYWPIDSIFNKLPVFMRQWEKEKAVLYPVEVWPP
jgi:hypothetical protein